MTIQTEPKYTVKQTAERTGLSLNQIRLWERRYSLVSPQRADNGYRMYSQSDLDILSYVNRQNQKGIKIGELASKVRHSRDQILKDMKEKTSISRYIKKHSSKIPNYDLLINAIQMDNPYKFHQLLCQSQAGFSFIESVRHVDLPILAKLGELSMAGKVALNGTVMASAMIRERIMSHIESLDWPQTPPPIMLAGAPYDFHEMGLLYCWLELTANKQSTVYLGPHMSVDDLVDEIERSQPKALMVSLSAPMNTKEREAYLKGLKTRVLPLTQIAIGGYEASQHKEELEASGFNYFKCIDEALQWMLDL